ncbi:unnamed protein product [Adineta ricciae]|nr:unnamed protein product [Adineta ricciae]
MTSPIISRLSLQVVLLFHILNCDAIGLQANDFYVENLPLLPQSESSINMHAGYLPVNSQNHGSLFFWHFPNKFISDKSRTIIWLNGGPGQSSLIGAWTEIGPFRFINNDTMVVNNGSWHFYANLLFIDQPIGTGFSYAENNRFIKELDVMAEHFVGFLDRYIEVFPKLLEDDIYLAGESFAGQYIPYIAKAILEKRSVLKLRGLIIGSGWIDPVSLYDSYLPYALLNDLLKNNSAIYTNITRLVAWCHDILSKQVHVFVDSCFPILDQIINHGRMSGDNTEGSCINAYDIRLTAKKPICGMNGPLELEYVSAYLNRPDVMSRLHINGKKSQWKDFIEPVHNAFHVFTSKPSIALLPDLLRQIPILFFHGEYDIICNHVATENMLDKMTWNDAVGFNLANGSKTPIYAWMVDDESVGYMRYARNLTYILFYNAGHMVPYDQSYRSRIMLHQFIQLNLTYSSDQSNTNKKFQCVILIITAMTVIIVLLIGIIWLFISKEKQCMRVIPARRSNTCQSKRQSAIYSPFENVKDEFVTLEDDALV